DDADSGKPSPRRPFQSTWYPSRQRHCRPRPIEAVLLPNPSAAAPISCFVRTSDRSVCRFVFHVRISSRFDDTFPFVFHCSVSSNPCISTIVFLCTFHLS